MSVTPSDAGTDGDEERDRFVALLDSAAARSRAIPFWWRDDDAITSTPQLARLLSLARRHQVPLALAVVPKDAEPALAEALADEPQVYVLQHGWQHMNHSPADEKKMELGEHRPLPAVLDELARGFERLNKLMAQRFVPALVPPWNRIANAVRDARSEVGLPGFSGFGPAPADAQHWVNTHVDIIDWRARRPQPRATLYAALREEVERRLTVTDPEPLGILTHHLVHQDGSWDFLDEFLALTADHAAVHWPPIPDLYGLSPAIANPGANQSRP